MGTIVLYLRTLTHRGVCCFLMPFEFLLNRMLCLSYGVILTAEPFQVIMYLRVGLLFNHLFCGVITSHIIFMLIYRRDALNSWEKLMLNCSGGFPWRITHFIV